MRIFQITKVKNFLDKLFNKNNIKTSYICISNMESVIYNHNAKLLKDPEPTVKKHVAIVENLNAC